MMAEQEPTSLYRYYDSRGYLLYVGITGRGASRNSEHNKTKIWWQYVDRQQVEHFPTRALALAAERRMIQTFRPPFNIQHNPDHESAREIYEATRETAVPTLLTQGLLKARGRRMDFMLTDSHATSKAGFLRAYYQSELKDYRLIPLFRELSVDMDRPSKMKTVHIGRRPSGRAWRDERSIYICVTAEFEQPPSRILTKFKCVTQKPITLEIATVTTQAAISSEVA